MANPTASNNLIGFRVKFARENIAHMTQKQLADKLYVSQQAVSQWESGKTYVDVATIPDLAKALQVDTAWLLNGFNSDTQGELACVQAIEGIDMMLLAACKETYMQDVYVAEMLPFDYSDLNAPKWHISSDQVIRALAMFKANFQSIWARTLSDIKRMLETEYDSDLASHGNLHADITYQLVVSEYAEYASVYLQKMLPESSKLQQLHDTMLKELVNNVTKQNVYA